MISRSRNRITLVAVFVLALAAGMVIATLGLPDRIATAVTADRDGEAAQVRQLTAERDALAAQQRAADDFAARVAPGVVRDSLTDVPVTLVSVGGDQADTAAVAELVTAAGGTVSGRMRLTEAVADPARAEQLRELAARLLPAGAQLPASSDAGTLAGGLLGAALLDPGTGPAPDPGQAEAVVAGLAAAGFAEQPATPPTPGRLAVVVTGGAAQGVDATESATTTARLAAELDRRAGGAVLAGRTGSAGPQGAIGVARGDDAVIRDLSTVDGVQSGAGRVATVLALGEQNAGRAGQYGSGDGASGPVPAAVAGPGTAPANPPVG
ncbi:copper transporter [Pseudonocardia nantongensis]|uniref:copper transporter n=1 Tax=Pseudonocardia nantongensis TaxID=1181885 RepID=UPI00397A31AF